MSDFIIRPASAADEDAWHPLWKGYIKFYGAEISDEITKATWARLLDPSEPMNCLIAEDRELGVIGIEHYILHASTWTKAPVCYLQDLFVAEKARNLGAGRALIETLSQKATEENWYRVYWLTDRDNTTARKLYDKVTTVTNWVRYDISTT
ncbi:MAG: GNAT family N-acetyltransferase [Rhodospirillaceae bacterium]|jgi:GNAT superfamily N-acetyltransferase|nr:GNAT family N-acetyltransferase [Rhodospirillales bacterium]MBT3907372.1 GNAT family N-acetyltransferase [Rhodospirillaceae bacterium]MBT4701677.1 GNAT family N-acetyltransferase [Rhodospirillaceae bacterium]MBT5035040.1 GNAT family N-acetyltransferase [Rhodospirillaceae bacterium]MBT6221817.1 GNAT family N-acetyltransferase [Rhodospirillaceae bacterium]